MGTKRIVSIAVLLTTLNLIRADIHDDPFGSSFGSFFGGKTFPTSSSAVDFANPNPSGFNPVSNPFTQFSAAAAQNFVIPAEPREAAVAPAARDLRPYAKAPEAPAPTVAPPQPPPSPSPPGPPASGQTSGPPEQSQDYQRLPPPPEGVLLAVTRLAFRPMMPVLAMYGSAM